MPLSPVSKSNYIMKHGNEGRLRLTDLIDSMLYLNTISLSLRTTNLIGPF